MTDTIKKYAIMGIGLLVIIGGILLAKDMERAKETAAWDDFQQAKDAEAIQAVYDTHKDTKAGTWMAFHLANLYFSEQKTDKAIELYKRVVDAGGDHYLLPYAIKGYADCLKEKGKTMEADKLYDQLRTEHLNSVAANLIK